MTKQEKEILKILQEDSRVSPEQIAIMVGLEAEEVKSKIKEWEDNKVIIRYHTYINWDKLGDERVSAMIDVKIVPQRDAGYDIVAKRIYKYPEVRTVFLMSGGYDLAVMVEGKSLKDVALFVAEKLATIEHVQSTTTHFVLKKYKQGGVILNGKEEDDQRLVVTP